MKSERFHRTNPIKSLCDFVGQTVWGNLLIVICDLAHNPTASNTKYEKNKELL